MIGNERLQPCGFSRPESSPAPPEIHRQIHFALLATLVLLGFRPGIASADVCLSIDEARDTFSPQDRTAALLLLTRQFEMAGERVVPAGCETPYVVSHIRLGTTVVITLSGPKGERDATASGMDDVPAVYSQMVRSLLRGQPMDARGIVDRTNVSATQAAMPNRIHSDSLFYARLGYGALVGDRTYAGPSVGMIGYRREHDAFGIDVSFLNFQLKSSDRSYGYVPDGSAGTTGSWLKLELLHFSAPLADRSPYFGAGLSWSTASLNNQNKSWSGSGLQGELTAGYELGRAGTIRVFIQGDAGLPFYTLRSETYSYSPSNPYGPTITVGRRYAPSLAVSMGIGWQRGGGK
jgi:hypothetical protein